MPDAYAEERVYSGTTYKLPSDAAEPPAVIVAKESMFRKGISTKSSKGLIR